MKTIKIRDEIKEAMVWMALIFAILLYMVSK